MLTIIESPFQAATPFERKRNIAYARKCVDHALARGESPIAFHILYTQPGILNDDEPTEREIGMARSFDWAALPGIRLMIAFYIDFGMSPGMLEAEALAQRSGNLIQKRQFGSGEIEPIYYGFFGGQ